MAQMTQKTLAIGDAERLPDPLPLLTNRIQHHLPAQALLRRIRDVEADLTQALTQTALLIVAVPVVPAPLRLPRDSRPWREKATILPRWPSRSSVATVSAMVNPVPITATRACGAMASSAPGCHGLAISAG